MELVLYVTFICFLLLDKQPQTLELDGVIVVWNGGEGGAELVQWLQSVDKADLGALLCSESGQGSKCAYQEDYLRRTKAGTYLGL